MPIIDGKVVRARYTKLKLNEISSVDNPAQAGALAAIMKRDERGNDMSFMEKILEIQKRDGGSHHNAMRAARIENPELFLAMQQRPIEAQVEKQQPSEAQLAVQKARRDFMERAHTIAARDGVPMHQAMRKARTEAPELFAAYG